MVEIIFSTGLQRVDVSAWLMSALFSGRTGRGGRLYSQTRRRRRRGQGLAAGVLGRGAGHEQPRSSTARSRVRHGAVAVAGGCSTRTANPLHSDGFLVDNWHTRRRSRGRRRRSVTDGVSSRQWSLHPSLILLISAPSLGVYYCQQLTLSVRMSICHAASNWFFFYVSRWNRAIFGCQFSMWHSTKYCS